jgi:D-alanyl-D-alanine carboxypeptidase
MTPLHSIISHEDDASTTARTFPALPQLILLGVVLAILLGSAGTAWLSNQTVADKNPWIESEYASTPQSPASLTTESIRPLADIDIEAKAGFVYDITQQRVLFQKSADEPLPIASITKLMTALVAHELLSDETTISIPSTATVLDSTSGLRTGERLNTKSLLDYSLLASSNDAAHTLATAGGALIANTDTDTVFVEAMNLRAKELKLPTLVFHNAHGLDKNTTEAGAYGSARDVSFLLEYIYRQYPELLEITTEDRTRIYNANGEFHDATNTNRVRSSIPQLLGSKTGYTVLAGGNLTVVFDAGFNRPIIVTVLGSSFAGRFTDVLSLIKATQASFITSSP